MPNDIRPGQRWRCKARPEVVVEVELLPDYFKSTWLAGSLLVRDPATWQGWTLTPQTLRELYTLEDGDAPG